MSRRSGTRSTAASTAAPIEDNDFENEGQGQGRSSSSVAVRRDNKSRSNATRSSPSSSASASATATATSIDNKVDEGENEGADISVITSLSPKRGGQAQSSSNSSRTRQKRKIEQDDEDDEDERPPRQYRIDKADLIDHDALIEGNEKQVEKFNMLQKEAQDRCVKTIVRALIMKGARKELLTRSHLSDCLGKVDPNYKKHLDVVLGKAQQVLGNVFGYSLTTGEDVRGLKARGKRDELYVTNALKSPALLESLSEVEGEDTALMGFAFVVFQILFTSPAREASGEVILGKVRQVDPRFPETLSANPKGGKVRKACPIPELKEDFLTLLGILKRKGYLTSVKDEREGDDPNLTMWGLGIRFAAEMGKRSLMRGHFATLGECVDEGLLKEFKDEEDEEEESRRLEDLDEGE